jgi:hypothetical protein
MGSLKVLISGLKTRKYERSVLKKREEKSKYV